jgi:hypothetical protein
MREELAGVAIVPLIVGVVEAAKRAGLRQSWAPLLAVGLGLLASVGWAVALDWSGPGPGGETIARAVLVGLALGLSASGLYSGARRIGVG